MTNEEKMEHVRRIVGVLDGLIPGEQVLKQTVIPMPVNKNVEVGKEEWWEDLSIYNQKIRP